MSKWLLVVLVVLGLGYVAICVAVFAMQRSLIYYPAGRSGTAPTLVLHADGAEVVVSTHVVAGPRAVLYFGGNAEDVSHAVPDLVHAFPGASVYAMHYRGYGGSTGSPSEAALVADALRLHARVAADHPEVTAVGRSLGSGIALQLAATRTVQRLVLVTPYDSMLAMAAGQFPWLPTGLLLRDRYDSVVYAPRIDVPTTLVVATEDAVIPPSHSHRLAAAFRAGIADTVEIAGAGHNDVASFPGHAAALAGPAAQAREADPPPEVPAAQ